MAVTIDLEVQQPYFDAIKSGIKTIEGRLAKQKYLNLQPGDSIRFTAPPNSTSIVKTVAKVHRYATFREAFKEQNFQLAIPDARSVDDAVAVYERFYPRQIQDEIGVVFIELASTTPVMTK